MTYNGDAGDVEPYSLIHCLSLSILISISPGELGFSSFYWSPAISCATLVKQDVRMATQYAPASIFPPSVGAEAPHAAEPTAT